MCPMCEILQAIPCKYTFMNLQERRKKKNKNSFCDKRNKQDKAENPKQQSLMDFEFS